MRPIPCPQCSGTPLRWSAAVHVVNLAGIAFVVGSVYGLITGKTAQLSSALLLCALVLLVGATTLRAEVAPRPGTGDTVRAHG